MKKGHFCTNGHFCRKGQFKQWVILAEVNKKVVQYKQRKKENQLPTEGKVWGKSDSKQ